MPQRPGRGTALAAALALAVLAAVGATAIPSAAEGPSGEDEAAAPTCDGYETLRSVLDERFGERPASSGLADDGTVVLVFAAPGSGTWTMVSLAPDGTACVLATGESWQQESLARQGEPA